MSQATFLVGDVFERMAELEGPYDLVMTSPPFYRLRSYLPDGHPDKAKEIGSELTPADFIDILLDLTAEWGRLLAPHGSICVELGDTYAGSGGAGGDYDSNGMRDGQPRFTGSAARTAPEGKRPPSAYGAGHPEDKSLLGIPDAYALSLEYGWNVLRRNGPDSPAGRWRVRNKVAWVRPNPPVGALGDKFRPATSYLTIACRARDRYFDLDAVRTPLADSPGNRYIRKVSQTDAARRPDGSQAISDDNRITKDYDPTKSAGAPPLDWWNIPPTGYPGAHYAVYPPELCVRPILAMTPQRVCTICGQPSRRIVEKSERYRAIREAVGDFNTYKGENDRSTGNNGGSRAAQMGDMTAAEYVTVGWSDCDCPEIVGPGSSRPEAVCSTGSQGSTPGPTTTKWRPGHVLDPFAGSGTTLAVATGHGREATGIDIDPRNADLAQQRCGMFLTIDERPVPDAI